jgi:hypothetical protein
MVLNKTTATVSFISKICYVRIFSYMYVAIRYWILDYHIRSCNCVFHQIQTRREDLQECGYVLRPTIMVTSYSDRRF